MSAVAFLGLGAMGSRMAQRLVSAGHSLIVWNRDPTRAEGLVSAGATLAKSPVDAASQASVVIAMVRDDQASRAVWLDPVNGALRGLAPGSIAIECSTLTPGAVRSLGEALAAHDVGLLDAPVAGTRPHAEAGQLHFMVGGEAATLARAKDLLACMGTSIIHAGPQGSGAQVKLALNALLSIQVAAVAELTRLLAASGVDLARAWEIIGATHVASLAAKTAAASILAESYLPLFPIELVVKDLGYALEEGKQAHCALPMTGQVAELMQQALAKGLGGQHISAVYQVL